MEARKYIPHYRVSDWEKWEGDWELIGGIAFAMSPSPSYLHQEISGNILYMIKKALGNCPNCSVIQDLDWQIDKDTVVRPDLMLLCGNVTELRTLKRITTTPQMVVEIMSESTKKNDQEVKMDLYTESSVATYILVDPEKKWTEVYELKNGKFILIYQGEGTILPHTFGECLISADWSGIFY